MYNSRKLDARHVCYFNISLSLLINHVRVTCTFICRPILRTGLDIKEIFCFAWTHNKYFVYTVDGKEMADNVEVSA